MLHLMMVGIVTLMLIGIIKSFQMKRRLNNMDKVINVKEKKINCYDYFREEEMSDGRFILTNLYNGEVGIFKQSVIDMISDNDDDFWRNVDKYLWEG